MTKAKRIVKWYLKGWTYSRLAKKFGVTKSTVSAVVSRAGAAQGRGSGAAKKVAIKPADIHSSNGYHKYIKTAEDLEARAGRIRSAVSALEKALA